jgi:hypothetical protein
MLFEQFVQYVYGFYGKGGLWDMGVTREMIFKGIELVVAEFGADQFEGDSLDRERVRDAMIDQFGLTWPSN